jgi:transposase
MALGRQTDRQSELLLSWSELPRSQGHPFYDRLQEILRGAGFDRHVEALCQPHYSSVARGRKSLPPGRYFRMLLVGYFEGIDSERGIEWRCADSLSLREFLLLESRERVPDHSWLSRTRSRLPLEVHDEIFGWVLKRLAEHGLINGARLGVDASTMEAHAALRAIVRRETGEGYREMLKRLAAESGIETPTADDLIRLDRKRPGKKLSNEDWESPTDSDARIARMKDGRTRLAYKPEHAVDLDTGAILAAPVHHADRGDTKTLPETLEATTQKLDTIKLSPTVEAPAELVADKGYHSRDGLKKLHDSPWKTRITEPAPPTGKGGILRWHGDEQARNAVPIGPMGQPPPAALGRRQSGLQTQSRDRRARLRADPRPRRHAPNLAAWPRQRPETLSDPYRRIQPGIDHAAADRLRHPTALGRVQFGRFLASAASRRRPLRHLPRHSHQRKSATARQCLHRH